MFQKYGTIGKEIDMKTSMVLRPGSAALSNRALTLRLLFSHGALSRTDIADSLEITTAAVTSIVGELLEEGLVVQQDGGGCHWRSIMTGGTFWRLTSIHTMSILL